MSIYYVKHTALDFWRWKAATLSTIEQPKPTRRIVLADKPVSSSDALAGCAHFADSNSSVCLMVGKNRHAHSVNGIRFVTCTRKLPPNAFQQLNTGRYVASPEFTFLSLASDLSTVELALIGCELTGMYVMRPDGFSKSIPLTTTASLLRMLKNCTGFKGLKKATKACDYIVENAASPMESRVALLLTLPRRIGGYGLPKPCLNYRLHLSQIQYMAMKRNSITIDMMWPSAKFGIEYDSTAWHSGNDAFIHDSIRRNDIRSLGYDVTTITAHEYRDISRMNRIAGIIASHLGKHSHLSSIDPNRQAALHRALKISL